MKRLIPLAVLCLLLTACSPAPNRDQVVERFEIELAAKLPANFPDLTTLAEGLADDAFEGHCGADAYRTAFSESGLVVVWDATCSMYFEHDMTEAQQSRARETVTRSALDGLED